MVRLAINYVDQKIRKARSNQLSNKLATGTFSQLSTTSSPTCQNFPKQMLSIGTEPNKYRKCEIQRRHLPVSDLVSDGRRQISGRPLSEIRELNIFRRRPEAKRAGWKFELNRHEQAIRDCRFG